MYICICTVSKLSFHSLASMRLHCSKAMRPAQELSAADETQPQQHVMPQVLQRCAAVQPVPQEQALLPLPTAAAAATTNVATHQRLQLADI